MKIPRDFIPSEQRKNFLTFFQKGIDKQILVCYNYVNKGADGATQHLLSNILRPNSTDIRRITSVIRALLKYNGYRYLINDVSELPQKWIER